MKNLSIILGILFLTVCASSHINLTANIPDTQEIDIQITTKNKKSE